MSDPNRTNRTNRTTHTNGTTRTNRANRTSPASRITFACCVESGALEDNTVRLVESLRMFGGEFSSAHVVAVTPRRGPSLTRATLRRFARLGVDYVRIAPENRYAWMPYLNKYFALKEAERRAKGDLVAWLDSDILVLQPPDELLLTEQEDFGACARDKNVGTSGVGDEFEPYWVKACEAVGLSPSDLPWVETTADHKRIRLYWNSGVFVYRPESGFLENWRRAIEHILDRTDVTTLDKLFWTDQVALGLAAKAGGLRLRNLPGQLNYGIATHFQDHLSPTGLASAEILHYHDCMQLGNWPWFLRSIAEPLPVAHAWLASLGSIRPRTDPVRDLTRNGYRSVRQIRRRIWSRRHGAGILGR